jgi:cytochrome c oxidase subunit 1
MKVLLRFPQSLFLMGAILIAIVAFASNTTIDIHVHDTYYVIKGRHLLFLLIIPFLFFWMIYSITGKIVFSTSLIWIHFFLTTIPILFLIYFTIFNSPNRPLTTAWSFETYRVFNYRIRMVILILLSSQVLFLINIMGGIIKKWFE